MPTPESASFLAQKPKVPPTFDGVDYDDNEQLKAAQDSIIREQWVRSMMARLVRDELGKCYQREGVNHLEKCGRLRGMLDERSRLTVPELTPLQTATWSFSKRPRSRDIASRCRTTFLRSNEAMSLARLSYKSSLLHKDWRCEGFTRTVSKWHVSHDDQDNLSTRMLSRQ